MEGEYVEAVLSLLKKAGCMDLVRQEALAALRPARKAAQRVAAAVMACSPPRSSTRAEQVRRPGRAPAAKSSRMVSKAAGLKKGFRVLTHGGRGGAGGGRARAAKGRELRDSSKLSGPPTPRGAQGRAPVPVKADTEGEVQSGGRGAVLSALGFWRR
ncbi:hypothetical protein NDU88_005288 [Pleurodeles waltl]|uniref:Uncharacterized protein n=1 Tax=Pleurodeles waltl TaxID=8319 RepID=A0AAV7PEY5_PLEWA|nr:hypothetical protein NDU88_005288 [Pleurodeles waltl]